MRKILIAAVAVAALLPVPAWAQGSGGQTSGGLGGQPTLTPDADPATRARPTASEAMGRELDRLIGQRVTDPQGQELGDVENVLVDPQGKAAALVVEWGGLAGLGANQVAVPWQNVQVSPDGQKVTVNSTREQLEKQPKYDPDVPAAAGVDPDLKPLRR